MKIGIVTFHRALNFGAQMQMYALCAFLKRHGNDVFILNYHNSYLDDNNEKLFLISKYLRKNFIRGIKTLMQDIVTYFQIKAQPGSFTLVKKFENFVLSNFKLTLSFDRPEKMPTDFDCLITGSDQVWNYHLTGGRKEVYFLDNKKTSGAHIRRISYAASADNYSYKYLQADKDYIRAVLSRFSHISAREKTLAALIEKEFDLRSDTVLDPTFLLDAKEYKSIAKKPDKSRYVLVYYVIQSKIARKIANKIAKDRNLEVKEVKPGGTGIREEQNLGPTEVLGLILNADVVISTSFHATALSIISRKNFYSVFDFRPSARVSDLLMSLGLEDRYITKMGCFRGYKPVDYNEAKLNESICYSKNWLLNAVKES